MPADLPFGLWLKKRRKALDLTQSALADRVGCSLATIEKIESEERRPSTQIAELLADALEIPTNERETFLRIARRLKSDVGLASVSPIVSPPVKTNVPIPPTPLIGRESELDGIRHLLANPECRLVSLTGEGGIGKTRLGIEFAIRQRDSFPGGVYYVALASIKTPDLIVPVIADAFSFSFSGPLDPKEQFFDHLVRTVREPALLALDNLEHLLGASSFATDLIAEILQRSPQIKILCTSRERLNLQGEWMFDLRGLPVPPLEHLDQLEGYSATALFIQSAQRANARFKTEDEQSSIIKICQLLEGIPLAIELSAAWVGLLSCADIAKEIEANMDFLTTSMRDVPERHRSIRATIDHSWKLLSDHERQLLRRLSVFHGGFSYHAAEQVAGASLSSLASLHAKSIVHRTQGERYDLHDLLRKYALLKLEESPEELEHTKDIHCIYYLNFFGYREGDLRNERQFTALAEIGAEIENIRAAWHHAVIHNQVTRLRQPVMSYWFFDIRGWFQEAYSLFHWTIEEIELKNEPGEKGDPETIVTREHIRASLAWFCVKLGKFDEARKLLRQSLASLRSYDVCTELLNTLHHMGALERLAGNFILSQELFLEMLNLATAIGARWHIALAHGNVGVAKLALGEYQEAYTRLHIAITILREVGDRRLVAMSLQFFGEALRNLGRYEEAQVCLYESLEISKIFSDRWVNGLSLNQLGLVSRAKGEYEEAVGLFRDALAQLREIKEFWGMVQTLNNLGSVYLALGRYEEAKSSMRESLALCEQTKNRWGMGTTYRNLGLVTNAEGQYIEAQEYFQKSLEIFDEQFEGWDIAITLAYLADATLFSGDDAEAKTIYLDSLRHARQINSAPLMLMNLAGLAQIESRLSPDVSTRLDTSPVAGWLTLILSHPATTQETRQRAEELCAKQGRIQTNAPCHSLEEVVDAILK